ncbi:hypothetical protein EWM64_g9711 [Hericium alpestre]|uniref:RanBP2-type domain-containing protein n=1 Tax=Hericium alpestre TaxID=135208 RepID=A0A4Y9ZKB8_9AGAM|nr:hypothetical protein EWM64_g9711 [Hericium alpestre]
MSAIRRNDRRVVRNHISSPYKRPRAGAPKKSGWSLSSLFTFLNPFQGKNEASDEEEEGDSRDEVDEEPVMVASPSAAAETLSRRGHDLAQLHPEPTLPLTESSSSLQSLDTQEQPVVLNSPPATPGPSGASRFEEQPSPSQRQNLEAVEQFLQGRDKNRPLHQVEYMGIVELLKESTKDGPSQELHEPFRFSPSVSPTRGESPLFNVGSAGPSTTLHPQTPRKTLSKNPNGPYKWQSGGSTRPRNRYQSPAFGPPRPSPSKMKISPPETPKTDGKRRRVGADAQSSTAQPSPAAAPRTTPVPSTSPFPISNISSSNVFLASSTTSTAAGQAPNGQQQRAPATPRLRTSVPPKPTVPAMPSPLRQSWKESESPPQAQPSPPRQPTRAANFMSGLLKAAAPAKKPDVLNPYQTMSPVPPVPSTKKPLRKRKAAEQPKEKPKEKERKTEAPAEAGLSPQRIIEATVPKGSKRSRPPPDLQKRTPSPTKPIVATRGGKPVKSRVNGVNGYGLSSAEELSDEEEQPSPPKKQKKAESMAPTVEEVEDVDINATPTVIFGAKSTSTSSMFLSSLSPVKPAFGPKSSIPKEPSKLRFGFAAEPEPEENAIEAPPAPTLKHATLPKPVPPPSTIPFPTSGPLLGAKPTPATPAPSIEPVASTSTLEDAKAVAKSVGPAALPTFTFTIHSSPALDYFKERETAKAATSPSLPTFTLSFDAKSTATASASKSTGFDWAAAGMKPPSQGTDGWTCSVCMVKSPESAAKCIACEEPKPGAKPKPKPSTASAGFNWEAAGMKPKAAGGTWTCSECMLQNSTSVQKCTVCDAARP